MESTTGTANSTKPASAGHQKHRLHYSGVRDDIQDGDVLLWRGNYLMSKVFEALTESYYTHAAIAARWGNRLMILQAELVGIQAVPLSDTVKRYNGLVHWYKIKEERRTKDAVDRLLEQATGDLGRAFGIVSAIRGTWRRFLRVTGIVHRRLGFSLNPNSSRAMFCSQYVSHCFRAGGLQLTYRPDNDTLPGDVASSDVLEFKGALD